MPPWTPRYLGFLGEGPGEDPGHSGKDHVSQLAWERLLQLNEEEGVSLSA